MGGGRPHHQAQGRLDAGAGRNLATYQQRARMAARGILDGFLRVTTLQWPGTLPRRHLSDQSLLPKP